MLYKKHVSMMVVMALLLCLTMPAKVNAESRQPCGPDAWYELSEDGTLVISGTGEITKKFGEDSAVQHKIKKIIMEEGIEKIGERAFAFCNAKEVDLPQTLKKMGKQAFYYTLIKTVNIPPSVSEYGKDIFMHSDVETAYLPDNMKEIPSGFFSECVKLQKVVWPSNLTKISAYAFSNCNFDKFHVPDTVKKIDQGAFYCCEKLKTITIGKSVKKVSKDFISGCYSLKRIVNHSKATISLEDMNKKRYWYVAGKKVTKLKPGKTATAKYRSYRIKYQLNGGKVKGKSPKKYTYRARTKLPKVVKKKGYTFFGWNLVAKNDWELCKYEVPAKLYGTLKAEAVLKKYKVTSDHGRIKVTVKDSQHKKKGYKKSTDRYYYRYSETKDMTNAKYVLSTAPYGKGLSGKLKKGKTYYVEASRYLELYLEDSEDLAAPSWGWLGKKKITIR
ncbi:MAG: leucine-rich repeat protein [Eubacterium sp.]|jgi:hypothetical protein